LGGVVFGFAVTRRTIGAGSRAVRAASKLISRGRAIGLGGNLSHSIGAVFAALFFGHTSGHAGNRNRKDVGSVAGFNFSRAGHAGAERLFLFDPDLDREFGRFLVVAAPTPQAAKAGGSRRIRDFSHRAVEFAVFEGIDFQ